MGQLQISIRQFIDNKLNAESPLTDTGIKFNLYNRYAIEDQDFYDVVLNSIDWEKEEPFVSPYEGFTFNSYYATLAELNEAGAEAQVPGVIYYLEFGSPFNYLTYNEQTTNYDGIENDDLFNESALVKNNVVVNYDGKNYNTKLGQYTLTNVNYIPCIIEDFIAEYEPLSFVTNASYTIPIAFYINETIDRYSDNKIIRAVESFYNSIRGTTHPISDGVTDYTMLLNHTALTPSTGIIDFNGTIFREYQLVITLELIDKGYFGNQIQYNMSISDPTFVDDDENVIFTGQTFRVYPITATSTRASELHQYQIFPGSPVVSNNNDVQALALPNETGFMLELSFLHDNSNFSKWLYYQKYTPSKPKKITLTVIYPNIGINKSAPSTTYVIESIGGVEMVGEKIIYSLVLKPVIGQY